MSVRSISLGFFSSIRPGDVLRVDPPPPSPSSSSSSSSSSSRALKSPSNMFHAMVSTIFFVEEPHQKGSNQNTVRDGDHSAKRKDDEKESSARINKKRKKDGGEEEAVREKTQAEMVRVSLLATVYHPETPTVPPLVFHIASALFSSSEEETTKEACEVAFRLRMPLIFQSGHPAASSASEGDFPEGVVVQQLQVEVEKVDPKTGARTGVYEGPRMFAICLAGLQNTTLSSAQIQLLLEQGGEREEKGKTAKNVHEPPHAENHVKKEWKKKKKN